MTIYNYTDIDLLNDNVLKNGLNKSIRSQGIKTLNSDVNIGP